MASFSVTDAAFAGFRLLRERPKAILCWAAVQTALTLAMFVLNLLLSPSQSEALRYLQQHPDSEDLQAAASAMRALGPVLLVILAGAVAAQAVIQAAAYRAMLRPQESRWGYLRLGATEGRMALLMVLLGVLFVLFVFVLVFIISMLVAVSNLLGPLSNLINFLTLVGAFAAIAVVFTRFSLAAPATFAEGGLQVMRSWRLTRGYVGRLLAAYALMAVMLLVMLLLVFLISAALIGALALATGGGLEQVTEAIRSGSALSLPMVLLNLALSIFQVWLVAAVTGVLIGPSAESYRELVAAERT